MGPYGAPFLIRPIFSVPKVDSKERNDSEPALWFCKVYEHDVKKLPTIFKIRLHRDPWIDLKFVSVKFYRILIGIFFTIATTTRLGDFKRRYKDN